jgi:hypothetical protein
MGARYEPSRSFVRRSAWIGTIVVAVVLATWFVWDRPAVEIRVEPGGHAFVDGLFSRTPLPETVYVRAVGSHTVIRIVNKDTVKHHLGVFDAEPGETRDFSVAYAGTFGGFCSAHPTSKQLVYVIE